MATYRIKADGRQYTVEVIEQASGTRVVVEGHSFEVEAAAAGSVPGEAIAGPARTPAPRPAPRPP